MRTNEELQRDVQDAIKWQPLLNAAEIGVTVKNGVVSLTGVVDSFAKVESALKRNWSLVNKDIRVKVSDHAATLTGTVNSWRQKEEAGHIAWGAPGVWTVDNQLAVEGC